MKASLLESGVSNSNSILLLSSHLSDFLYFISITMDIKKITLALELSTLLTIDGDKCDNVSLLKRNVSGLERVRFTLETSRLTDFCPNSFKFERLEYLLGLLRIKQLDLALYNSTIDLQSALAHNQADFEAYASFVDWKTIVTPTRENITFVAPFAQDSICLVQSVNVMLHHIVKFDEDSG